MFQFQDMNEIKQEKNDEDEMEMETMELNEIKEENDSDASCQSPSSSSSEEPELETNTSLNLLPETSRKKYEFAYQRFKDWHQKSNAQSFKEHVIIAYFQDLAKKYKSSTLWTHYSMLRCTLNLYEKVDVTKYMKLRSYLKRNADGYEAKKSKIFTSQDIQRFIDEAPDDEFLLTKVALIIGISGGCKRAELSKMSINDMEDFETLVLIKVPNKKTNTSRTFTISGQFYEIYKRYAQLRPRKLLEKRFFLNYKNGECSKQVVGINSFGNIAKRIAYFLKLSNPQQYTGHCFRKSSLPLTAEVGSTLKRNESQKVYDAITEGSIRDFSNDRVELVNQVINVEMPGTSTCTSTGPSVVRNEDGTRSIHFHNCSNITINVTNYFK